MNHLLSILKWWNHLWTENLTPEQEANQILNFLLLKNSTTHSIEIFEALEVAMKCEMRKREYEASKVKDAVNKKWGKEPSIMNMEVNYEAFDKPLKTRP